MNLIVTGAVTVNNAFVSLEMVSANGWEITVTQKKKRTNDF